MQEFVLIGQDSLGTQVVYDGNDLFVTVNGQEYWFQFDQHLLECGVPPAVVAKVSRELRQRAALARLAGVWPPRLS